MNKILSATKCAYCCDILETPVILPCSDSICKKHINPSKRWISCAKCGVNFNIPQNGFPFNKGLAQIIEAEITKIDFGHVHKKAKESCKLFENSLLEIEVILKDPFNFTHEAISDLKNTVQLKGEELKLRIDQEMFKFFQELDKYENDCKQFVSSNKFKDIAVKLDNTLKNSQSDLDSWIEALDKIRLEEKKWKRIIEESSQKHKNITNDLISIKNNLLLNKFNETKESVNYFKSINIDPILTPSVKIFDSRIINYDLLRNLEELLTSKKLDNKKWTLLYRGSKDGFRTNVYSERCDNKPNTLTLIKAKSGNIFGGFLKAQHWSINAQNDPCSFLFSLVNNENRVLIFNRNPMLFPHAYLDATYFDTNCVKPFSGDIVIFDNFNIYEYSYSNLGTNYIHSEFPKGSWKSQTILAGSYNFQVSDIEVFQMQ